MKKKRRRKREALSTGTSYSLTLVMINTLMRRGAVVYTPYHARVDRAHRWRWGKRSTAHSSPSGSIRC